MIDEVEEKAQKVLNFYLDYFLWCNTSNEGSDDMELCSTESAHLVNEVLW